MVLQYLITYLVHWTTLRKCRLSPPLVADENPEARKPELTFPQVPSLRSLEPALRPRQGACRSLAPSLMLRDGGRGFTKICLSPLLDRAPRFRAEKES